MLCESDMCPSSGATVSPIAAYFRVSRCQRGASREPRPARWRDRGMLTGRQAEAIEALCTRAPTPRWHERLTSQRERSAAGSARTRRFNGRRAAQVPEPENKGKGPTKGRQAKPEHQKFAEHWVKSQNATEAYLVATGRKWSRKTAETQGGRWLRRRDVQDYITQLRGQAVLLLQGAAEGANPRFAKIGRTAAADLAEIMAILTAQARGEAATEFEKTLTTVGEAVGDPQAASRCRPWFWSCSSWCPRTSSKRPGPRPCR